MPRVGLCFLAVVLVIAAGSKAFSGPEFESPAIYPLAQEAKTVAVGDFNNDGRTDVAVTAWPSGLYVLYQQADGSFGPPNQLAAPALPLGLAVGDLNGDGRIDLAVGGANGTIYLYYQREDGTFGFPEAVYGYGLVNSLVIDDFNGDALADIASTSADFPVVLVSLQAPDGTFGLPEAYLPSGDNARCICTLDSNSDGIRDIALLLDNNICCLAGAPAGGFQAPTYAAANGAYALAAGDVTGDGQDDLVFTVPADRPYAAVGVIIQSSGGLAESPLLYAAYDFAQPLVLADLNEDGRTDVVTANAGYEAASALFQSSDSLLGSLATFAMPYCNSYEPGGLATGDLNSDGYLDMAVADWWNGLVVLRQKSTPPDPALDTLAPSCTPAVSGALGNKGWYISSATVTLTAQDNPSGSGVSDVLFTLDQTTWSSYSEPIAITAQGATSVGYYAVDNAGNRSATQLLEVKVDTAAPNLAIEPAIKSIWPPNGAVIDIPVKITAADSVSGLANLHLAVKDEYGLIQPEFDLNPGTVTVPLIASRNDTDPDGRIYTLVLTGTDTAGNLAQATSTVTVPRANPGKPDKPKKTK